MASLPDSVQKQRHCPWAVVPALWLTKGHKRSCANNMAAGDWLKKNSKGLKSSKHKQKTMT